MARIVLNLPSSFIFTFPLTVRISDINYGGHVGNDAILRIAHEARLAFIRHLGYTDEITITDTVGIIVSDAAIVYKAEAFYDDPLTVNIAVDEANPYGFDMLYQIVNTVTGKEIARLKTGIVCLNYKTRKISKLPEEFRHKLFP